MRVIDDNFDNLNNFSFENINMINVDIYKKHIFGVVGAIHEVHKELWPGLNEYCYQEGLAMQLVALLELMVKPNNIYKLNVLSLLSMLSLTNKEVVVNNKKFPTLMKRCKCSPEGVLRPQAGVKPLLKMVSKEALKGRQNVLASLRWQASRAGALSPLRGWDYILLFTGVLPLPMLFSGLRPLGWETSINK